MLSAALLLLGLGAVMIYSTTAPKVDPGTLPPFFLKQVAGDRSRGAVLAALAAAVPLRVWHALALPLWGVTVLALVATLAGRHRDQRRAALARRRRRRAS